jgi:hypothetical protein
MNIKMNESNLDADTVIAAFLQNTPRPTTEEWKKLIAQYPQFARDIADAALIQKACKLLDETDLEHPVNAEVFANTVSRAINLLHSTPSPVLADVQQKIAAVQGPAIRNLCKELGVGHAPLINGILVGAIKAPSRLLARLGELLDAPLAALSEAFAQSFASKHLPAYKSESGKPSVPIEPMSWEEAVRAAKLPDSEAKTLLAWCN